MFPPKPKDRPIIDWAVGAIAEIRRLEREVRYRDQTIAVLQWQIDKQESLIGQLVTQVESLKNGRVL